MNRIVKIGMDVHSTNYTLCAMEPVLDGEDRIFANIQVTPDYKNVLQFIENLKNKLGPDDSYSIECGYEAGCLGYSLYNQLTSAGVKCIILAPTTMLTQQGKRAKTDKRDAVMIAQCLSYGGYHAVHVPTDKDDSVKEYLRMRDDHKLALKKIKQQINAFCIRHGYFYPGTKWTIKHLQWLRKLALKVALLQHAGRDSRALRSHDQANAPVQRSMPHVVVGVFRGGPHPKACLLELLCRGGKVGNLRDGQVQHGTCRGLVRGRSHTGRPCVCHHNTCGTHDLGRPHDGTKIALVRNVVQQQYERVSLARRFYYVVQRRIREGLDLQHDALVCTVRGASVQPIAP